MGSAGWRVYEVCTGVARVFRRALAQVPRQGVGRHRQIVDQEERTARMADQEER